MARRAVIVAGARTPFVRAFGAFMVLYDARQKGRIGWQGAALAGLCAAGVSFFEYPGLFASLLLCIYALLAVRPLPRLLASAPPRMREAL